jgi:hypothetical protein
MKCMIQLTTNLDIGRLPVATLIANPTPALTPVALPRVIGRDEEPSLANGTLKRT